MSSTNSTKTDKKDVKGNSHYICRKLMDKNDTTIVADAVAHHQNVLLLGPRGTGKTTLAQVSVENILKRRFVYIPCHTGTSQESLLGQWIPSRDGHGYQWIDGILTAAVRNGYVCLLDEVNSLKPEVAFAIHGLLDHRRELVLTDHPGESNEPEVIKAHENFGLIAAGNPYYEGVRVMNEAFRDRFAVQIMMGYIKEIDVNVIRNHPVCERLTIEQGEGVAAFIEKVRDAVKSKAINADISTRAFIDFAENIANHTLATAKIMFQNRFEDEKEQQAIRTCFSEVWDATGQPQKLLKEFIEDAKRKGRAGKYSAGLTKSADMANTTF